MKNYYLLISNKIVAKESSEITPSSVDPVEVSTNQKKAKEVLTLVFIGGLMLAMGWFIADKIFGTPTLPIAPKISVNTNLSIIYKEEKFDIYNVPIAKNGLKLLCTDAQNVPFRDIKTLKSYLLNRQETLVFAMNAGMYTSDNLPKGLYIENKQTRVALDTAQTGYGNFYLMPNGVFAFDDTSAVVLDSKSFQKQLKQYNYATQSGPLLVVNNQINPVFTPESNSLFIRNGVGITQDGKIIFAISSQPVNFYVFAALFKEKLQCPNALFLDGAISKMYAPEANRFDEDGNLGPFVALTQLKH